MSGIAFGFPTHVVVAIVAEMAATAVGAWLVLSATLKLFSSQGGSIWRWGAAIVLAAWFIVWVALAINPPDGTVLGTSYLVTSLVFGMLVGLVPLVVSSTFRKIVRSMPQTWILDVHAIRIMGVGFLALADMKLLPPQNALPAGYGDITVGVLALVMLALLGTRRPYTRSLVVAWNLLGLLDFVDALITGIIYIPPFAAQLASQGVSVLYLNYVLMIPFFGVPLLTVLHVYSLYQILSTRAVETPSQSENAVQVSPISH